MSKHTEQDPLFPWKAAMKFLQHTWQEELGARIKHTDCSTSSFSRRKILFHWREFVNMKVTPVLFFGGIFFLPMCKDLQQVT